MEAMKYDLDVGDRSGTSIYDANITMILNSTNVDNNSYASVAIESESVFIHLDVEDDHDEDKNESSVCDTINEDSTCKKNDNSNNNIFDKDTTHDFGDHADNGSNDSLNNESHTILWCCKWFSCFKKGRITKITCQYKFVMKC